MTRYLYGSNLKRTSNYQDTLLDTSLNDDQHTVFNDEENGNFKNDKQDLDAVVNTASTHKPYADIATRDNDFYDLTNYTYSVSKNTASLYTQINPVNTKDFVNNVQGSYSLSFTIETSSVSFEEATDKSGNFDNTTKLYVMISDKDIVIEYDIVANAPANPSILAEENVGSANTWESNFFDSKVSALSTKTKAALSSLFDVDTNSIGFNSFPVLAGYVSSIDILPGLVDVGASGSGIKLGSTFSLKRQDAITNNVSPLSDISLTASYGINDNTIQITGGLGYVRGDTFTISGAGATSATIEVQTVGSFGEILFAEVIKSGYDFSAEPTVTYNGSTGSGSTATYTNDFSLYSLTVVSGGSGYTAYDTLTVSDGVDDYTDTATLPDIAINLENPGFYPIINEDNFTFEDITVANAGKRYTDLQLNHINSLTGNSISTLVTTSLSVDAYGNPTKGTTFMDPNTGASRFNRNNTSFSRGLDYQEILSIGENPS